MEYTYKQGELLIERDDYEEYDSPLRFGCRLRESKKIIYFTPILTTNLDGIYAEGTALSPNILDCTQEEIEIVRQVHTFISRTAAVYFELALYEYSGYPFRRSVVNNVLSLDLTAKERQKVLGEIKDYTYIYLIRDNHTGLIKMGRSNDPDHRLAVLKKQDTLLPRPNEFERIHCWEGRNYEETNLHKEFADKRVRGEWFALTEDDIHEIRYKFGSHVCYPEGITEDEICEKMERALENLKEV